MASPHVAGAAALLFDADPNLTCSQLYNALADTAKDLGAHGLDNDYGWGRIDVKAALDSIM